MKKLIGCLMIFALFCTASIISQAAEVKCLVSSDTVSAGQTVYLKVELSDCAKADTLGISFEYDSDVLKKITKECSWADKGVLQDFDAAKNHGVWASNKAKDLNGEICTLAFRVKADAPKGETEVTCNLIVKKGSKEIGTYTAKRLVYVERDEPVSEVPKSEEPETNPVEDSKQNISEQTKPEITGGMSEHQHASTNIPEEILTTEHQHTDACNHEESKETNSPEEKTEDNHIIWLVITIVMAIGMLVLIIKQVNKKDNKRQRRELL